MKYSTHHLVATALLLLSPASLSSFQFATPHTLLKTSRDVRSSNVVFNSLKSSASSTMLQMSDAAAEAPKEEEKKGFMGKVCYTCLFL